MEYWDRKYTLRSEKRQVVFLPTQIIENLAMCVSLPNFTEMIFLNSVDHMRPDTGHVWHTGENKYNENNSFNTTGTIKINCHMDNQFASQYKFAEFVSQYNLSDIDETVNRISVVITEPDFDIALNIKRADTNIKSNFIIAAIMVSIATC